MTLVLMDSIILLSMHAKPELIFFLQGFRQYESDKIGSNGRTLLQRSYGWYLLL